MRAKFTLEDALNKWEGKKMTTEELSKTLGCSLATAEKLVNRLRDLKKLVIHEFKPPENEIGRGRSAPVYRVRKHWTERDARRPTKGKSKVERKSYTLKRKLEKLKEERYIALCECATEEGREKVRTEFDQLIKDVKEEPREMQRVYEKRYADKKKINPRVLIERQPSLAMCWSASVKNEDE